MFNNYMLFIYIAEIMWCITVYVTINVWTVHNMHTWRYLNYFFTKYIYDGSHIKLLHIVVLLFLLTIKPPSFKARLFLKVVNKFQTFTEPLLNDNIIAKSIDLISYCMFQILHIVIIKYVLISTLPIPLLTRTRFRIWNVGGF